MQWRHLSTRIMVAAMVFSEYVASEPSTNQLPTIHVNFTQFFENHLAIECLYLIKATKYDRANLGDINKNQGKDYCAIEHKL